MHFPVEIVDGKMGESPYKSHPHQTKQGVRTSEGKRCQTVIVDAGQYHDFFQKPVQEDTSQSNEYKPVYQKGNNIGILPLTDGIFQEKREKYPRQAKEKIVKSNANGAVVAIG